MAIEKREMEIAKELDDVGALIVELVKTIKNKGDLTENIGELIQAINGVDEVDDEMAANRKVAMQTIGARVLELVDVFLPKA